MPEITLIRHGSLPAEVTGRLVGQCEVPLSELGRREAAAIGRYLAPRRFDRIYTGTLRRVRETHELASRVAPQLAACTEDPRLNEFHFGDWGLHTPAEIEARYPGEFGQWKFGNFSFAPPGGESMAQFAERTRAVFAEILATGAERIAIFSHGGVIMSLLCDWVGLSRNEAFRLHVVRGGVAELTDAGELRQIRALLYPLTFYSE